jgi:hypothetical protein
MKLCGHTCPHQPAGILQILFQEEIKGSDPNKRWRKSLKPLGTSWCSIRGDVCPTKLLSQECCPSKAVVVNCPDVLTGVGVAPFSIESWPLRPKQ